MEGNRNEVENFAGCDRKSVEIFDLSRMNSEKKGVVNLVEICARKGVKYVVIAPGSRNSPLTIAFLQHPAIQCLSIIDERSAGYFALGIAQHEKAPVAVICTSGTAVLNFGPAIAEAYYQRLPLLVITADRPVEWIDQGDGQAIRQNGVFANYVRGQYQLPDESVTETDSWHHDRLVSEAINKTMSPFWGPVHINVPLREPLYGQRHMERAQPKMIAELDAAPAVSEAQRVILSAIWQNNPKKMLIAGLNVPDPDLNEAMNALASQQNVVVLTETTSNLEGPDFFPCIDRLINSLDESQQNDFAPDLLITTGGPLISRKIKAYLRKFKPRHHWHVDPLTTVQDAYQAQTLGIPMNSRDFLKEILSFPESTAPEYRNRLAEVNSTITERHDRYLSEVEFCDLKVIHQCLQALPDQSVLHVANSAPVRYVQLFELKKGITCFANRGTSGIDGSTSTAVGHHLVNEKTTTLITGDLSFIYDSNGLWNNYLSPRLKIIIVNNSGGGIFRFIEGPATVDQFEEFIETTQEQNAKGIASTFGLDYNQADDEASLVTGLHDLYGNNERAAILEVFTPRTANDQLLKQYFTHLKG